MTLPEDDNYSESDTSHMPSSLQEELEANDLQKSEPSAQPAADAESAGAIEELRGLLRGTRFGELAKEFMNDPGEVHASLIGATFGAMVYSTGNVQMAFAFASIALGLSRIQLRLSDKVVENIQREPWYAIGSLGAVYALAELFGIERVNEVLDMLRLILGGWGVL